jgi:very-short-patch-repair endonuclease
VHLSVDPARRPRLGPPVRVHRVGLDDAEVTRLDGLAVTARAVTVLDCLPMLGRGPAGRLFDRALQQGWLRPADIERRLRGRSGRPGNQQLRRLAGQLGAGAESAAERILHRLLRRAGIAGWQAQLLVRLAGCTVRVDVAFPAVRLAIEVDGRAWHSDADRFQADRTRQNALVAAGWTVLRFTWTDLVDRPDQVVQTIRRVLAELAA